MQHSQERGQRELILVTPVGKIRNYSKKSIRAPDTGNRRTCCNYYYNYYQNQEKEIMMTLKLLNSKFKIQNSKSGFTLVELLVVMVIIGVMGVMLGPIFGGWWNSSFETQKFVTLQREGDRVINYIAQELQDGNIATIGASGSNDNLTITKAGGTTIYFAPILVSTAKFGNILLVERDGALIIKDYVAAGIRVDSLNFNSNTVNGKQEITTTLSLKYVDEGGKDRTIEFRTTTLLRNS